MRTCLSCFGEYRFIGDATEAKCPHCGKTVRRLLRGMATIQLRDPERAREIAASGGRTAHEKGTAHQFTKREQRKGGKAAGKMSE